MKNIFTPWILVTFGIVFNISSAVITHYFIDINNQKIRLLDNKISNIDTLIEGQWRAKTQVDRKEEFLLSMLAKTNIEQTLNDHKIHKLINTQLNELIQQNSIPLKTFPSNEPIHFDTILSLTLKVKQNIIDTINNSYLERIDIEKQRQPLTDNNGLLTTLAIFLQMSGLILVLSKDINA